MVAEKPTTRAENHKIIDLKNMLEYIRTFDGICEKYDICPDKMDEYYEVRNDFSKHETQMLPHFKHREYSITLDNLKMIYGENDAAWEMLEVYIHTLQNVICGFINIDGIDRLFSEYYFDFEWGMHTHLQYSKGQRDFYRDHFVHQIRVFYELMLFIDDYDNNLAFLNESMEAVRDNRHSIITKRMDDAVKQEIRLMPENIKIIFDKKFKKMFNCDKYSTADENNLLSKVIDFGVLNPSQVVRDLKSEPVDSLDNEGLNELIYVSLFRYLMRLACTLAALFHDIGYPINHSMEQNERLTEYISLLYSTNDTVSNFKRITSLLENSLLFKIVHKDEIRARISNHGVLSALTFLLHFYENGSIYNVSPIQKAAIEIAAVAIYDHNIQYRSIEGDKSDNYYKPYFKNNPVGFLLRMCDDLQEWNRMYFDYQYTPSMNICPVCKTPIVNVIKSFNGSAKEYVPVCLCTHGNKDNDDHIANCYDLVENCFTGISTFHQKISTITTQKISIVGTCDSITLSSAMSSQEVTYNITLNYKPYKLLQMSYISSVFSKFRVHDLQKLKMILDGQFKNISIQINYFLTTNPLLLKMRLLQEYCKRKKYDTKKERIDQIGKLIDSIYKSDDWCKNVEDYEKALKALREHILNNTKVYIEMIEYYESQKAGTHSISWENIVRGLTVSEPLSVLLSDARYQIDNYVVTERESFSLTKHESFETYRKVFVYKEKECEDYYYDMISAYCDTNISPNVWHLDSMPEHGNYLDFYSDLLLYQYLQ